MQNAENSAAIMPAGAEPITLLRRIGQTTYMVTVRFSESSKETAEDKILRLVEQEAKNLA